MVSTPDISKKSQNRLILGFLLGTLAVILWALFPRFVGGLSGENYLFIHFYDVGQGDAILIQEGDTQILVDGGPNDRILTHLGRDLPQWDREIELLVLTHPQADHLTGVLQVLERYKVKRILYYPSVHDTKGYEKFLEVIKNEGAQVLSATAGGQIQVGEILLQIMWPTANYRAGNVNNESVVLVLDYGDFEALLLGDVERKEQAKWSVGNSDIEVIKMAHHGSWNGTYEPLLHAIAPDLAIISAGANNQYEHPHDQTLNLLAKLGVSLLRTDLDGTITVKSDGRNFWYYGSR